MAHDSGILADVDRSAEHHSGPRGVPAGAVDRAELTVEQILAWADAYRAEYGAWPTVGPLTITGPVPGARDESWRMINHALAFGLRGLPGDSSLAELLAEHRGAPAPDMGPGGLARKIWAWEHEQFPVRGTRRRRSRAEAPRSCPALTTDAILGWAEAHRAATGRWPTSKSGPVRDSPFALTWTAIDSALRLGCRGLPGGSSLTRLIPGKRRLLPELTVERILAWADAHFAAYGAWPALRSGPVGSSPGETWQGIDNALRRGRRGLGSPSSLARLLSEHRGRTYAAQAPRLTEGQILAWADAHRAATGRWPDPKRSGVAGMPGETWSKIDNALARGHRGLPGGSSVARLLGEHRGARNLMSLPPLTAGQILAWAEAHRMAHGRWPTRGSGPVTTAPGETWCGVNWALYRGRRGLPGGQTLGRLLATHPTAQRRPLTPETIQAWAAAHHRATGLWPTRCDGAVADVPGETWRAIDRALQSGQCGLPGRTTLAKLLGAMGAGHATPQRPRPKLTIDQVLAWIQAHRAATGQWPRTSSGPVAGVAGEHWGKLHDALRHGCRGLPAGKGLAALIRERLDPTAAAGRPERNVGQLPARASAGSGETDPTERPSGGGAEPRPT
jgi:hypothetical protein